MILHPDALHHMFCSIHVSTIFIKFTIKHLRCSLYKRSDQCQGLLFGILLEFIGFAYWTSGISLDYKVHTKSLVMTFSAILDS